MLDSAERPIAGGPARQRWMATLAKASLAELEQAWAALPERPAFHLLRAPETGLVMVRGRIGGTGAPFNLGEMIVTRCAVTLEAGGSPGFGHVAGRSARRATLAAAFDALLLQDGAGSAAGRAVAALAEAQGARKRAAAGKLAATRVEFFTMVRE